MTEPIGRDEASVMRRSAGILAIILLACAGACDSKTEPGSRPATARPAPGPAPTNSWLISPPNQQAR